MGRLLKVPMTAMRTDMSTWRTQEGQVIAIKDMVDSHLVNSINMVKRRLAIQVSIDIKDCIILAKMSTYRTKTFDKDVKQIMTTRVERETKLKILLAEANKRNLEL